MAQCIFGALVLVVQAKAFSVAQVRWIEVVMIDRVGWRIHDTSIRIPYHKGTHAIVKVEF
jgi:hypothetical protein